MARDRDRGVVTPVEMMYLLVFCLVAVFFLGFLGRLHAAAVEVTNTAQAAARAASLEPSPAAAEAAVRDTVDASSLSARCAPVTTLRWSPSATGSWRGGSVTVEISCTVHNSELTGVWSPGSRTVVMRDTQPVDRYHR